MKRDLPPIRGTKRRRSDENIVAMHDIVLYVYNDIPGLAWASPEKVKEWRERVRGNVQGV